MFIQTTRVHEKRMQKGEDAVKYADDTEYDL